MTILEYVNDLDPQPQDLLVQISFEPIKQQLKRDLKKWEKTQGGKSTSGSMGNLKRWHPDLYNDVESGALDYTDAVEIAKHRKTSHSDKSDRTASQTIANVAVDVDVIVDDTVNVKEDTMAVCTAAPSDRDIKNAYSFLVKDVLTICGFIRQNRPKFIEPYMDLWNLFAEKKAKPTVKTITKKRQRHLKARLTEQEFDLEEILRKAKDSKFLMGWPGFTFDWIIDGQDNYVKILEGKYDKSYENGNNKTQREGIAERHSKYDEWYGQTGS